jgi:hypothetical protein
MEPVAVINPFEIAGLNDRNHDGGGNEEEDVEDEALLEEGESCGPRTTTVYHPGRRASRKNWLS